MSRRVRPFMRTSWAFLWLFLAISGVASHATRAELVISEFLAANQSSLLDEDGEASDWIELHNTGSSPVSVAGWFLTDDPADLKKWVLPGRNLAAGGYLVVFASGKDRSPAEPGRLHSNFRLNGSGEFLALVRPDGVTVTTEFRPTYPPQDNDLSYGTPTSPGTVSLLSGASVSVLVPTSPTGLAADWTTGGSAPGAAWSTTLGFPMGLDSTPASPGGATNLALGGTATQSTTGYGLGAASAHDGDLNTFSHTATDDNASSWLLDLRAVYEIRRIVLHNRAECCQTRFRDLTVTLLAADGRTALWTSALLNPENRLDSPASITLDLLELDVEPVPARFVRVSRTPDPDLSGSNGIGNPDEDSVLSLGDVEVYGVDSISYAPLLRTDLTDAMLGRNPSAFVRVPFLIESPEALGSLSLRLRHDDGVVVYLNGQIIITSNAPTTLTWNAAAPNERSKTDALIAEVIDLTPFRHLGRAGTNWLAFQILNVSATDPDLLLDADLIGEKAGTVFAAYLERPTPGAPNDVPWNLGKVADTDFGFSRGFASAPFDLPITTTTPGAEIRYTLDGSLPTADHGLIYTNTIRVTQTTVVRAAAFKRDYRPTNVDTHTFVLLDSTIAQPSRPAGFPTTWAGLSPDYGMDTRITQNPAYAPRMAESLKSLPTLSLATEVDNLFGPSRGIYSNPERSGLSWERPVSLEWIEPDTERVFQADAGVRIQGGYFRSRNATHKHSLRLLFKDEYGPGRLRTDLFEVFGAAREFDTLVLRAGANDGYAWDAAKDTEQFLRDEFGRRLHLGMGQVSPHGRFVHLYLNGLYWGLYNLTERPAEDFSASYFGGVPENWDAINSGDVKNGSLTDWNTFITRTRTATTLTDYQRLKGLSADGSRDPSLPAFFDAPNYMDYMLLNIWGGNWDWPNKNFWFGRDRTGASGGFKFYLWDFENTMGNNRDRSPLEMVSPRSDITGSWVGEPHDRLRRLDEYRMEFADRVHRHCFNQGVLSPAALIGLYRELAQDLEPAIIAETARWGDDHHSPPQDLTDWLRERDWLLGTYLARRTDVVLNQFRASGLYPQTVAPSFSPAGGSVSPTTPVTLRTVGASELFYTTNGLDPRLPGGAVRAGAVRIALQDTGPIASPNLVRSGHVWRYLADATHPGDAWNQPGFTDTAWPGGPSPLGYGDGDEATTVPFVDANPTTAGVQKNPITYFRTTFEVPSPAAFEQLRLTVTYDDAAAVYLNGTEILRTPNLPAGAPFDAYASGSSSDNAVMSSDTVPARLLRTGTNVLAVEIRQSDGGSSDISFDLELIGVGSGESTFQNSGPLFFASPTRLMARARRGNEWSALNEGLFLPGTVPANATNLVISQFCYRPPDPTLPGELAVSADRDDYEFIEFLNIGTATIDLSGDQLTGGVSFTFSGSTLLDPGERALLVRARTAFETRYGTQPRVLGEFQGRLANNTDSLALRDGAGALIQGFTYQDSTPWPASANAGFALVLIQPNRNPDPKDPANWRASASLGGSPGRSDSTRFQGNPTADANQNGQADLLDYAFGVSLDSGENRIEVGFEDLATATGIQRYGLLSFPRNVAAEDVPVIVEQSNLIQGPWQTASTGWVLVGETRFGTGMARQTYRSAAPMSPTSELYLRLSVRAP